MDALSLSSSLSISKPFQFHSLSLSSKQQRTCQVRFGVSCRATTHGNLYKILSLSSGSATMDEIKRAYRSMALQYHPDVCHDPSLKEESTRMFVQLNEAYKTLSNPMLRAQYDGELGLRRKMSVGDHQRWESGLQDQVIELKKRSRRRMGQKGGSWASRMRAQNMKDRN
ncbi:hypothetical protein VNO77_05293 [Canavalia gladiata]|uniref:J domain-containing protein n=1 Tax=Canavalia gladiata TaxID=3824 RepID=A0AAN9MYQ3_CANGL